MLVGVESYLGDALIFGKVRSGDQLKYRVRAILKETLTENFISVFCTRYKFEVLPYKPDVEVDYMIDLDICHVYKPTY